MTTSQILESERQRKREKRSTRIIRKKQIWPRLGVGRTKGDNDFILHDPSDPYVPGTTVPRLKLARLGPRCVGAFEDEVDDLVEALRQHRDAEGGNHV